MGKRKRIDELYYVRAIAAMGILIIHATAGFAVFSEYGSKAMYIGIFLNQFFRFGSPIFMMVSGMVLFYNYRSMEEFDIKGFYIKKIKYIIVPYIIWSIIYILYRSNPPAIIRALLLGEGFSHLYFIFLIFQFYLILPLLIKYLVDIMKKKPMIIFTIFMLFQGAILIYGYYFKNPNVGGLIGIFNQYYWKSLFAWSFYFMAGGLLGLHYNRVVKFIELNIKGILIAYILIMNLYIGQVYYNIWQYNGRDYYDKFGSIRPHTMIYALLTMAMLLWITRRMIGKYDYIKDFGIYSFGIYFAHPLILDGLQRLFILNFPNHIGYSRLSSLIFITGAGLALTFIFILIVGNLNSRWVLIGRVPKKTYFRNLMKYGRITI